MAIKAVQALNAGANASRVQKFIELAMSESLPPVKAREESSSDSWAPDSCSLNVRKETMGVNPWRFILLPNSQKIQHPHPPPKNPNFRLHVGTDLKAEPIFEVLELLTWELPGLEGTVVIWPNTLHAVKLSYTLDQCRNHTCRQ